MKNTEAPARTAEGPGKGSERTVLLLVLLALLALAVIAAYLFVGLRGNWEYALIRRGTNVAGMVLVAFAVAASTVLFQTVTENRILTPSIMGFDALYLLLQTALAFSMGAQAWSITAPPLKFGVEVLTMVAFSLLLYRWLFRGSTRTLHLMLLIGIVFGSVFRGVASLLQRLMDPNEYLILQGLFFATFNRVNGQLLGVAALIIAAAVVAILVLRHRLDVLALGRSTAINLGLPHRQLVTVILVICAVLVSVSTALVGPVTFFGLLVANLAYLFCRRFRHSAVLPMAVLLGVIALVGGQLLLEHVFRFSTALSVIIEFLGGIVFITLLIAGSGTPRQIGNANLRRSLARKVRT